MVRYPLPMPIIVIAIAGVALVAFAAAVIYPQVVRRWIRRELRDLPRYAAAIREKVATARRVAEDLADAVSTGAMSRADGLYEELRGHVEAELVGGMAGDYIEATCHLIEARSAGSVSDIDRLVSELGGVVRRRELGARDRSRARMALEVLESRLRDRGEDRTARRIVDLAGRVAPGSIENGVGLELLLRQARPGPRAEFPRLVVMPPLWGDDTFVRRPLLGSPAALPGVPWVAIALGTRGAGFELKRRDAVSLTELVALIAEARANTLALRAAWMRSSDRISWSADAAVLAAVAPRDGDELILHREYLRDAARELGSSTLVAVVPAAGWLLVTSGTTGDPAALSGMRRIAEAVAGVQGQSPISTAPLVIVDGKLEGLVRWGDDGVSEVVLATESDAGWFPELGQT